MTETTRSKIPPHLLKYVVEQNYARYTPEDQATWRYILRQLRDYLARHAHGAYLTGLQKTGITIDRIPEIAMIDRKLNEFGWGAVPVSGFIPPAAFMEFQAIGVLPIASDMRSLEHFLYTPAPDIVHEAAGHAPIIADPDYASYLRQYGEVARHAIISKEDMDQYEAIRVLSDIKEDPRSTPEEIAKAEMRLQEVNDGLKNLSEAALLSRMNWWTAEYGLVGDTDNPKIFGAGLLSSVGESRACLQPKVKKIPLSVDCVTYAYDITEQQPQLFVARDFAHLSEVLDDLATSLSYRRGGVYGLDHAVKAQTVNTVQLDTGIQISGLLKDFLRDAKGEPCYLQFAGPSQLSLDYQEIEDQGVRQHAQGYSTPLGKMPGVALKEGERARLPYDSGVVVEGRVRKILRHEGETVLITFTDCRVSLGERVLFDPAWGVYDMAVGENVVSVFGGPADRDRFGDTEDFVNKKIPLRQFTPEERSRFALFQDIRDLRETPDANKWRTLAKKITPAGSAPWLAALELVEIGHQLEMTEGEMRPLLESLERTAATDAELKQSIADGLRLAPQK